MVLLLITELANVLHELIGFFKRFEFELLLHISEVSLSLPAVVTTTVHDVLNDVLVHHLELSLAFFVESLVGFLQLSLIRFCCWEPEHISWHDVVGLNGYQQTELAHLLRVKGTTTHEPTNHLY